MPLQLEPWIIPIARLLDEQDEKNRVAAEARAKQKGRHRRA